MTNRNMVNGNARKVEPNEAPLPPMPAPENAARPTTQEDPVDSPQPNAAAKRGEPAPGKLGLSTER